MDFVKNRKVIFFSVFLLFIVFGVALFLNQTSENNNQNGKNGINIDNGDTKINWSKYSTTDISLKESVNITESGVYNLTGEIEDGSVTIDVGDTNGVVKLVLSGVSVNSENGPAIYIKSADDVIVETKEGTLNYLISGSSFGDFGEETVDGTIYSKGDLTFSGDGYLYVESNYQDAIVSKDDLTIRSGEILVSSVDDGIRGKDSVNISGGKISIKAKQDGIKATNDEDKTKGFIYIEDGEITISVADDGIHATTSLVIDGGKIDVQKSYEGLEGAKIVVNGGDISIVANDDGMNVAGGNDESAFMRPGSENFSENVEYTLVINDGSVYVDSTGDGLDSNGTIYINGGDVVVDGPINSANGALDSEKGIYFNGGSVVAVGASGMAESFNDSSSSFGTSIFLDTSYAKDTKISVVDENDNVIVSHLSTKSFSHINIGSEKFEFGKTYTIYINDEEYESFTISSAVTSIGNTNIGPQGGGMQPQGGGKMPQGGPRGF